MISRRESDMRTESVDEKSRRLIAESRALANRFQEMNVRIKELFARSKELTNATCDRRKNDPK